MRRLLIANRGEIACRIMRTAQRMGVTSIAVFSDADRGARHVRVADESYWLGAAPAADSYLNTARIIAVARSAGADCVHPGYGFLSENAAFAQACIDAGLTFVGPPPAAIRAMGSKSAAKSAMSDAGVPGAPGYHGEDQSIGRLCTEAVRIGFPLIIKASAGGGGKGMQVVESAAQVSGAVESAQRLARAAFGDGRLLLERYFPHARHVEVQILADRHGTVLPLFDRDCSIQRRHQKVIEEAPAPGIRPEVRAAMAEAAVRTARAVDYSSAGTVEFLMDDGQQFYFMEMNTRLQVEHAVTELITGIDLVEWQLRIAAGERLPASFGNLAAHGAAIEARLYAEDPARDYLPSVGRIAHLRWPAADGVRVDAGVDAGDEVSSYYDPMLGKVIAWGETRSVACALLGRAVAAIELAGVASNRALLSSVLADGEFLAGAINTDFLVRRGPHLAMAEPAADDLDLITAALWHAQSGAAPDDLWADSGGWRLGAAARSERRFGDRTVTLSRAAEGWIARVGECEYAAGIAARTGESICIEVAGRLRRSRVTERGRELHLFRPGGHVVLIQALTEDALGVAAPAAEGSLRTPLPGTVVAVHVRVGQQVAEGAPLVTGEAMKMEHTLTAPRGGVVARVVHAPGERVAAGDFLIELSG